MHFFQHLNKANPDFCAQVVYMNTRKEKINIHTGSVSEMALFTANFQEKNERKKIFKVCLVGTLNLCLKEPEKKQKTRNQSNHPRQRKLPKTGKNLPNYNFAIFWQFWGGFSA